MVDGNRGITLTCKSSTGNILPMVLSYREVRDGNGPTRGGMSRIGAVTTIILR